MPMTVHHLDELIAKSSATAEFKKSLQQLQQGQSSAHVSYNRGVPAVKALRAITKLLEVAPELQINTVEINATSGCSDFVGTLSVNDGVAVYEFDWDCAWRAKEEKYTDHFGLPDQIRAAREFGYQCFKKFKAVA